MEPEPVTIQLEPLRPSGIVYHKTEILKALRVYLQLGGAEPTDVVPFEDGENFFVRLKAPESCAG